jgi:hypothetical protein
MYSGVAIAALGDWAMHALLIAIAMRVPPICVGGEHPSRSK